MPTYRAGVLTLTSAPKLSRSSPPERIEEDTGHNFDKGTGVKLAADIINGYGLPDSPPATAPTLAFRSAALAKEGLRGCCWLDNEHRDHGELVQLGKIGLESTAAAAQKSLLSPFMASTSDPLTGLAGVNLSTTAERNHLTPAVTNETEVDSWMVSDEPRNSIVCAHSISPSDQSQVLLPTPYRIGRFDIGDMCTRKEEYSISKQLPLIQQARGISVPMRVPWTALQQYTPASPIACHTSDSSSSHLSPFLRHTPYPPLSHLKVPVPAIYEDLRSGLSNVVGPLFSAVGLQAPSTTYGKGSHAEAADGQINNLIIPVDVPEDFRKLNVGLALGPEMDSKIFRVDLDQTEIGLHRKRQKRMHATTLFTDTFCEPSDQVNCLTDPPISGEGGKLLKGPLNELKLQATTNLAAMQQHKSHSESPQLTCPRCSPSVGNKPNGTFERASSCSSSIVPGGGSECLLSEIDHDSFVRDICRGVQNRRKLAEAVRCGKL